MAKITIQELIATLKRVRHEKSHRVICDALSLIFEEFSVIGYGVDMKAFHERGQYDGVVRKVRTLLDDQKSKLGRMRAFKNLKVEVKRRQALLVALLESVLAYFPSERK